MSDLPPICCHDLASARLVCDRLVAAAASEAEPLFALAITIRPGLAPELLGDGWSRRFTETIVHRHPGEALMVGLGCAHRIRAESSGPFIEMAAAIGGVEISCSTELRPYVRFFGGGAFDPRRLHDEKCWVSFGNASLILPALTYWEHGERAVLVVVTRRDGIDAALEHVERLLDQPSARSAHSKPAQSSSGHLEGPARILARKDSSDQAAWALMLEDAQKQMSAGQLSKVVAARRVTFELSRAPELPDLIDRLLQQVTPCTIFALRLGSRVFFGATPETLVQKAGEVVHTEALAGTRALHPSQPPEEAAAALLASEKDRREHVFVVEEIQNVLREHCSSLSVPDEPGLHFLRGLVHLRTPVHGRLGHPMHILELVSALHPTPAVGGVPRSAALDFISSHESAERGWYAAPIGWCTPEGDGRFMVALRSALLNGNKVHVYAGAGIVERSDAPSEYAETELKMSSVLHTLGLAS